MTFNKSSSLDSQRDKSIVESDHSVREQVELDIDTSVIQSSDSEDEVQDPDQQEDALEQ